MGRGRVMKGLGGFRAGAAIVLVLAWLVLLATSAAAAAVDTGSGAARRVIVDWVATPSWTLQASGDDSSMFECAVDAEIAGDGAVYVAGFLANTGSSQDVSLLKIRDGVAAWAQPRTYDGPYGGPDSATAMALGPGDVIYIAGGSAGASGQSDVLLLKYSKAGKRLWARRYDGPGHGDDYATAVGVDALGNVTVAATSTGVGTKNDCAVVSWSSSGVRRWTWRYDGPTHGDDIPSDMLVATDGSVYVTAQLDAWQPAAKPVALTARLSASGKKLWTRPYSGPAGLGAVANAMVARPGGGIYLAGETTTTGSGRDGLVMRYTPKGGRTLLALDGGAGGATDQRFLDVAVASTRQVVAVGQDDGHPRVATYTLTGQRRRRPHLPQLGQRHVLRRGDRCLRRLLRHRYLAGDCERREGLHRPRLGAGRRGRLHQPLGPGDGLDVGNFPAEIVVRDTTAVVVGSWYNGATTGRDQFVLGYLW